MNNEYLSKFLNKSFVIRYSFASIAIILSFAFSAIYRVYIADEPINDLYFPFCGAEALLQGIDPYGGACVIEWKGHIYPPNPMTTILAAVPFIPLGANGGPIVLWSLLTGLLVFGLLKDGKYWSLLVLLSAPYWNAFMTLQWSPLITAIALLPYLLPLGLIKPHIGLPAMLTNLTWKRILASTFFLAITFIVDPFWVFSWLPQIGGFDGYIPFLALPFGLLLLLSLLQWKDKNARYLFLMSVVPQRGIYDLLPLMVLPKSPLQLIIIISLGWLLHAFVYWFHLPLSFPTMSVLLIYLPSLLLVLPIKDWWQSLGNRWIYH